MRVLVLMACLSLQALAGDDPSEPAFRSPDSSQQQKALDQVREELSLTEWRWYGLTRIRYQETQSLSAGLGAMLVKQSQNVDCSTGCEIRGWHFEIEPGLYGMQVGVGWGKLVGETGRTNRLMHTVHFGWNVRGVIMRTWGDNGLYPHSQTLAGIEAGLSIIRLNVSFSVMRSLYSGPGEQYSQDWVLATGFGWGF